VEALAQHHPDAHLVLCGDATDRAFLDARQRLNERCHLLEYRPNAQMPEVLAAVDIVPVLQQKTPYTQAQVPAKPLEAMAMEKAVIATPVSDLEALLGNDANEASRG